MMSKPAVDRPLNPRQLIFVKEYLVDLNGTQAATRAGYSAKTANEQAARLLADVRIKAAVAAGMEKRAAKVELSAEWILEKLRENVERAMQAIEVTDREGNHTGEYKYDGGVANRALELLGKHVGMFTDKHELLHKHEYADMTDDELEATLDSLSITSH